MIDDIFACGVMKHKRIKKSRHHKRSSEDDIKNILATTIILIPRPRGQRRGIKTMDAPLYKETH